MVVDDTSVSRVLMIDALEQIGITQLASPRTAPQALTPLKPSRSISSSPT